MARPKTMIKVTFSIQEADTVRNVLADALEAIDTDRISEHETTSERIERMRKQIHLSDCLDRLELAGIVVVKQQ